jgi:hypothetical protein
MANSKNLDLEEQRSAGRVDDYHDQLEVDRVSNANKDKVDLFVGQLSASFSTKFYASGTLSTRLAPDDFYGGQAYARHDRIIEEVVITSPIIGSSGVTTIDIERQEDGVAGAFVSIFADLVFKPILSQSVGADVPQSTTTISGTLWPAGTLIRAHVDEAAVDQADTLVEVFWRPSGSYGA